jgi:hypothetical protein
LPGSFFLNGQKVTSPFSLHVIVVTMSASLATPLKNAIVSRGMNIAGTEQPARKLLVELQIVQDNASVS